MIVRIMIKYSRLAGLAMVRENRKERGNDES